MKSPGINLRFVPRFPEDQPPAATHVELRILWLMTFTEPQNKKHAATSRRYAVYNSDRETKKEKTVLVECSTSRISANPILPSPWFEEKGPQQPFGETLLFGFLNPKHRKQGFQQALVENRKFSVFRSGLNLCYGKSQRKTSPWPLPKSQKH